MHYHLITSIAPVQSQPIRYEASTFSEAIQSEADTDENVPPSNEYDQNSELQTVIHNANEQTQFARECAVHLQRQSMSSWLAYLNHLQQMSSPDIIRMILSQIAFKNLIKFKEMIEPGSSIAQLITTSVINTAIQWESFAHWKFLQREDPDKVFLQIRPKLTVNSHFL